MTVKALDLQTQAQVPLFSCTVLSLSTPDATGARKLLLQVLREMSDGHRENCLSLCPMLPHDQKAAEIWLQRV